MNAEQYASSARAASAKSVVLTSVDTSNPATDRHRKTGHHAGEPRLVSEIQ